MAITRRNFLAATGGATAAPWIIPALARGADGNLPPSERIQIGVIGCGFMSRIHMNTLLWHHKTVRVAAVCDPDETRRRMFKEMTEANYAQSLGTGSYKGCDTFRDYRDLLARKDIDAVLIVTPDHWHTPISIAAAKAGKDIYCEKPVSHTLLEGRRLVEAVQKNKRVFQNGSHYRSMKTMRPIVNFIRAGGMGKIKQVFVIWKKELRIPPTMETSWVPQNPVLPEEPVPAGLDWDLWVGPAPMRGYNRRYHNNPMRGVVPWNFCADFGTGDPTFYHSHAAEIVQYAIGQELAGPTEIHHPSEKTFPTLTLRYPNGVLVHHVCNWEDAKKQYPEIPKTLHLSQGFFGGLFLGERGWIAAFANDQVQGSEDILHELGLKQNAPFSKKNDHHENWFTCIRTREKPYSHEEIGHRSAAAGHLVNLCYRLERSLKWDPVQEVFPGDDEANKLRTKIYRAPYGI